MTIVKNSTGARAAASLVHGYGNLAALEETPPLVIASGKGVRVFDEDGKSYIEGIAGMWCASFGFSEEAIIEAAIGQLRKMPYYHTLFDKTTSQAGALAEIQSLPTLPADVTERRGFSTAEIAVHPTGTFLYASTRGHNSIAMYTIDAATGRLAFLGAEPARAKTPRHFAIAPGGRFLLTAGQDSGTVAIFALDAQTGGLSFTDRSLAVPGCVCICFRHRGS